MAINDDNGCDPAFNLHRIIRHLHKNPWNSFLIHQFTLQLSAREQNQYFFKTAWFARRKCLKPTNESFKWVRFVRQCWLLAEFPSQWIRANWFNTYFPWVNHIFHVPKWLRYGPFIDMYRSTAKLLSVKCVTETTNQLDVNWIGVSKTMLATLFEAINVTNGIFCLLLRWNVLSRWNDLICCAQNSSERRISLNNDNESKIMMAILGASHTNTGYVYDDLCRFIKMYMVSVLAACVSSNRSNIKGMRRTLEMLKCEKQTWNEICATFVDSCR